MDTTVENAPIVPRITDLTARRRRLWREIKDQSFKYLMWVGGVAIIGAIAVIFFYLLYVVAPLFKPASVEVMAAYPAPGGTAEETLYLATEEYGEVGLRLTAEGRVIFFQTRDGMVLSEVRPAALEHARVAIVAAGYPSEGMLAFGLANGSALVIKPQYQISYPNDKRQIKPELSYPLGSAAVLVDPQAAALNALAIQGGADRTTLVAATADHRLVLARYAKEESLLGGETNLKEERVVLPIDAPHAMRLVLSLDQNSLFIAGDDGAIDYYDLRTPAEPKLIDHVLAVPEGARITDLRLLAGGISLLVGDTRGVVSQWFPVRGDTNQYRLAHVREFKSARGAIVSIVPEYFRKSFAAIDATGHIGLYHTTAERTVLMEPVSPAGLTVAAVSPRADVALIEDTERRLHVWSVYNEHPEVSLHSLWGKVWYESRARPEYIWQSSAANSDFEPKYSLTPLTFGTLKAAFYAMLFAIPLSIMGAIYTAYFMSARMRGYVKPTIELMGALPTVILGFLAGLWLAPLVEARLAGILLLLLLLPPFVLTCGYLWSRLPASVRHRVPDGHEAVLLIPVLCATGLIAMSLSGTVEQWLFDGNMTGWITANLGLRFDQRNSLVVGLAMGFAVVPIIFSISEDAIFSVPRHLTVGSLALGATPWQTLMRVVLLTASPGIFSAIMIGLGRAVGETMIVLMATGNTPVMDFNLFEGFRALSANTAVEMPESEVNSTHFRILFLASLLLFLVTFVFNTAAEIVRQRLRGKYSNL